MGIFSSIGRGFKKLGKGIGSVAKKVGRGIVSGAKAIGRVASKIPFKKILDVAGKIASPLVKGAQTLMKIPGFGAIPIVGQAAGLIAKGGDVADIIGKVAKGDIKGALGKAGGIAAGSLIPAGGFVSEMAGKAVEGAITGERPKFTPKPNLPGFMKS